MRSSSPLLLNPTVKESPGKALVLPRLERSYSPFAAARSPNNRISRSEKLLLPDIRSSKCSSSRNSKSSNTNQAKTSAVRCGVVYGYAVQSHMGSKRHKKEDRVSIVMNVPKPLKFEEGNWPRSCYFGLFDGHSGTDCANFLKEHLHNNIFIEKEFPSHVKQAIFQGFVETDRMFLAQAEEKGEMSGSCALIAIVIANKCIIAGSGDSRAVVSYQKGSKVKSLINPHVAENVKEQERIKKAGGSVSSEYFLNENKEAVEVGHIKVNPGRLHVSRAFGNLDAKLAKYGGNPLVVIPDPDITNFTITPLFDFLLLATNSLFELFGYREVVNIIWTSLDSGKSDDLNTQLSIAIDDLMSEVDKKRAKKNITCLLIPFKNIKEAFTEENI